MRPLGFLIVSCATLTFAGCDSTQKADSSQPSMGVINSKCPLSGMNVAGGPVEEYDGNKIGLCCRGCIAGWNGMSVTDKNTFVAQQLD